MIRSRRIALIAAIPALAVMALSSCGDDTDGVGTGSPKVIQIGANSGGSKLAGTPGAESSAAGDAAMWAPWVSYTYSFVGDASGLPSSAAAWSFDAGLAPDAARVAEIAESLGLSGELQPLPAEYGGGWVIGSTDYTGPSLQVGTDGMLSWWYNPGPMAGSREISVGCVAPGVPVEGDGTAVSPESGGGSDASTGSSGGSATPDTAPDDTAVPDDTTVVDEPCVVVEPTPPANVPDKAEAETLFRGLLADWGYDADAVTLETYADDWGAYVTGYLSLGGFRSPASVSAGFGEDGALTWASGTLATAAPAGDYPLVSVDEAIARLNDRTGKWGWFGGWMAYAKGGVAMDTAVSATADVAIEPAIDPAAPVMPPDTMPEPEEIAVEFTSVSMELTTVWGEDGTIYVLPAYSFTAADGTTATMVAVGEEYLDLPDPAPVDSVPVDSGPGDTGVVSTDVVTSGTDVVPPTPETLPAEVDMAAAEASLVGLTLEEATKVAEGAGWTVRVSTLDGEGQALTDDYLPLRVNVAVEAGVITGIDSIG